ncbi:MAG: hypothetical protein AAF212_10655, partial [Verrucomicrobiota bacterium]
EPILIITIVSGGLSVILFFLVALASREIGEESSGTVTDFHDIIGRCFISIFRGIFRGGFKTGIELVLMIAFVLSLTVFGVGLFVVFK